MPVTTTYQPSAKKHYTYQDYLQTPEGSLYQLLNGKLIMSPSPFTKHQIISREIEFVLQQFTKENKLGEIFNAPMDVYFNESNCVQPDLFFISKENSKIITEKNIQGAPDLVIEIVSSTSIHRDTVEKKQLYQRFGVKEYWLVFPDEEIIEIYILKNDTFALYQSFFKEDTIDSPLLKGLKFSTKDIFVQ